MGWDSTVWSTDIASIAKQHIHSEFTNKGGLVIFVIVVGRNMKEDREELWDELILIKHSSMVEEISRIVMGDLNEARYPGNRDGRGDFDEEVNG